MENKKYFKLEILTAIFFAALSVMLLYSLGHYAMADSGIKYTEIQVFNPYKISMELETKCDWVHEKQKYKFYAVIKIKGKSNAIIRVSRGLNKCEVWAGNVSLF